MVVVIILVVEPAAERSSSSSCFAFSIFRPDRKSRSTAETPRPTTPVAESGSEDPSDWRAEASPTMARLKPRAADCTPDVRQARESARTWAEPVGNRLQSNGTVQMGTYDLSGHKTQSETPAQLCESRRNPGLKGIQVSDLTYSREHSPLTPPLAFGSIRGDHGDGLIQSHDDNGIVYNLYLPSIPFISGSPTWFCKERTR